MTVREVCLLGFNPQLHMLESYNSNMRHRADKAIDSVGLAGLYDTDFLTKARSSYAYLHAHL